MNRPEQVSPGAGVIAAVLAGLIIWFLTASAGWLWFRRLP
jgi:hypothetical protein